MTQPETGDRSDTEDESGEAMTEEEFFEEGETQGNPE